MITEFQEKESFAESNLWNLIFLFFFSQLKPEMIMIRISDGISESKNIGSL